MLFPEHGKPSIAMSGGRTPDSISVIIPSRVVCFGITKTRQHFADCIAQQDAGYHNDKPHDRLGQKRRTIAIHRALLDASQRWGSGIEEMLKHGEEIPVPTPPDKIDREVALLIAAIDISRHYEGRARQRDHSPHRTRSL